MVFGGAAAGALFAGGAALGALFIGGAAVGALFIRGAAVGALFICGRDEPIGFGIGVAVPFLFLFFFLFFFFFFFFLHPFGFDTHGFGEAWECVPGAIGSGVPDMGGAFCASAMPVTNKAVIVRAQRVWNSFGIR